MNKSTLQRALVGVLIFSVGYFVLHAISQQHEKVETHTEHSGTMHHNHGDMITSEKDFIQLMIPHHQEAVDTTTLLLQNTKNPALQTLGSDIIQAQTKEIALMNQWLSDRYPEAVGQPTAYMPMMRPFSGLQNDALDTQRTTDMIVHHQGALEMAEKVLTFSQIRPEVKTLAEDIIVSQSEEIETMNAILTSLPTEGGEEHSGH